MTAPPSLGAVGLFAMDTSTPTPTLFGSAVAGVACVVLMELVVHHCQRAKAHVLRKPPVCRLSATGLLLNRRWM